MSRCVNCPHPPDATGVRRRPAQGTERDHCTTITETYCATCNEVVHTSGEGTPASPWAQ